MSTNFGEGFWNTQCAIFQVREDLGKTRPKTNMHKLNLSKLYINVTEKNHTEFDMDNTSGLDIK